MVIKNKKMMLVVGTAQCIYVGKLESRYVTVNYFWVFVRISFSLCVAIAT